MMRKFINSISVILTILTVTVSFSLTSCGGDDNEPKVPEIQDPITSVKVKYSVSLADTWYNFFQVEMTYTMPGGGTKTEVLERDREQTIEIPYDKSLSEIMLQVIAKPKTNHPEVEEGKIYSIDKSINLDINAYTKSGKSSFSKTSPFSSKGSTKGDAFKKALTTEHSLYKSVYAIPK